MSKHSKGGLGAVNTQAMYISLMLSWIKRLFNGNAAWVRVFKARCHPYAIEDLLNSRFRIEDIMKFKLSEFYVSMLLEYRKLNVQSAPSTSVEVIGRNYYGLIQK